jgi:hypothetical protein
LHRWCHEKEKKKKKILENIKKKFDQNGKSEIYFQAAVGFHKNFPLKRLNFAKKVFLKYF